MMTNHTALIALGHPHLHRHRLRHRLRRHHPHHRRQALPAPPAPQALQAPPTRGLLLVSHLVQKVVGSVLRYINGGAP